MFISGRASSISAILGRPIIREKISAVKPSFCSKRRTKCSTIERKIEEGMGGCSLHLPPRCSRRFWDDREEGARLRCSHTQPPSAPLCRQTTAIHRRRRYPSQVRKNSALGASLTFWSLTLAPGSPIIAFAFSTSPSSKSAFSSSSMFHSTTPTANSRSDYTQLRGICAGLPSRLIVLAYLDQPARIPCVRRIRLERRTRTYLHTRQKHRQS